MLAYLDCFSGISGDMLLGALLHAGLDLDELRAGLAALPLSGYTIGAKRVTDHGLSGVRCVVHMDEPDPHGHRHLREIREILAAGRLPERARERALAIFTRLAEAEGAIHGVSPEEVGFHEVGAVDSIVDFVGTALGFEILGIEEVYCSELPLTSGRVRSAHGPLPVPAPATLELLKDSGVIWKNVPGEGELVTPTGAAVIATLAKIGRPDRMTVERVGYGFGQKKLPWANCLRLLLGERARVADPERDEIVALASNIDNMTGEALGWLMDRLLSAGALDVSYTPLQMKKNRPGAQLTVLAAPDDAERLSSLILRESATLGVRMARMERRKADRREEIIETPLGAVRVKLKMLGGRVIAATPEYEDCRALAERHGLPLENVVERVTTAARIHFGLESPDPLHAMPAEEQKDG
jgi:pyridinium-3,5-bisthiocarboxylic acid mononucleotide nickel chelatase